MQTEDFDGGALRYIIHPERGLMWSVADIVRAVSLGTAQGKQIVAYAPGLAEKEQHPQLPHLMLTFMPHEVTQHWLRNRIVGHALWNHLNRWNLIRKFPTIPAPAGLPLAKNKKVRDVAPGAVNAASAPPDVDRTRIDCSHITPWLVDRPVGILYVDKTPWVLWSDVCQYIKPESGLTGRATLNSLKAKFPVNWDGQIRRVVARNRHHVLVISPALFTVLMRVWCFDAYKSLTLSEHNGLTLPEVWAGYALAHHVERRATLRDTKASLRMHDFNPNGSDSGKEKKRKLLRAEAIARQEMGTYEDVKRNIKPE